MLLELLDNDNHGKRDLGEQYPEMTHPSFHSCQSPFERLQK